LSITWPGKPTSAGTSCQRNWPNLTPARFDLRDTIDILNHQLEGYQAVLERANFPED
jgi:hypothetical protein